MTGCHCPISVICLVCKGEDLSPGKTSQLVIAGAGRETRCALARIAVRLAREWAHEWCVYIYSASCVSHTPAAACRRCWPSCARPSSSYERCPCLQFAPAGHAAQEPGRHGAAQHGRARSGFDRVRQGPACAPTGRAQRRGRAGALLAGVHGAGTTMRGRNERAGVVRHGKVRTEACSFASFSGSTGILGGGTRRGFCAPSSRCGTSTSSKHRTNFCNIFFFF